MDFSRLVHQKEHIYFTIATLWSLLVYAVFVLSVLQSAEVMGVFIVYIVLGTIGYFLVHGLMIGSIRGNGVKLSPRQFPDVFERTARYAKQLEMDMPDVYMIEAGGIVNAFATRFLRRNFVVLYSEVVELAREKGDEALGFVIAHELGHHKRGHLRKRPLLLPARITPFLGSAYSRACEYTCDRFGAYCAPAGARDGLLTLAAGTTLYHHVAVDAYVEQIGSERGFWVWLAEKVSSHPNLPKRLLAVHEAVPAAAGRDDSSTSIARA